MSLCFSSSLSFWLSMTQDLKPSLLSLPDRLNSYSLLSSCPIACLWLKFIIVNFLIFQVPKLPLSQPQLVPFHLAPLLLFKKVMFSLRAFKNFLEFYAYFLRPCSLFILLFLYPFSSLLFSQLYFHRKKLPLFMSCLSKFSASLGSKVTSLQHRVTLLLYQTNFLKILVFFPLVFPYLIS